MLSALQDPIIGDEKRPKWLPWALAGAAALLVAALVLGFQFLTSPPVAVGPTATIGPSEVPVAPTLTAAPTAPTPTDNPSTATPVPPLPKPAPTVPAFNVVRNDNPCPNVPEVAGQGDAEAIIAIAAPLSGSDELKGRAMLNAACLAYARLQDSLAPTVTLRLASFDDKGLAAGGEAVAKAIVEDERIACVVGHRGSNVSLAALPFYNNVVFMISPSNSNPAITNAYSTSLRLAGNDVGQAAAMVEFLIAPTSELLGVKRLLVIHDRGTYATDLSGYFVARAEASGLTIVSPLDFDEGMPSNLSELDGFLNTLPDPTTYDAIYLVASKVDDTTKLIQNIRGKGLTMPILITDASDSPEMKRSGFENVYVTTMAMPPDLLGQFGADYLQSFPGGLSEDIQAYTGESYDATLMCIQAIRDASGQQGDNLRAQVIQAKLSTLKYEKGYGSNLTVTGPYEYDATRNFLDGGYYFVRKISNGSVTTIDKYLCSEASDGSCTRLAINE